MAPIDLTYVLPIRCGTRHGEWGAHGELVAYLATLVGLGVEVIVVDNSAPEVFREHGLMLGDGVRHVEPDSDLRTANGKVGNVVTGIRTGSHERVVIADDDVRHDASTLREIHRRLAGAELIVPVNVFDPSPWHARWDTGRILLNRALGNDYPGTLGGRRSAVLAAGGYDGDVLFENLELMRTLRAAGYRVVAARDLFVVRRPPSTRAFFGQRVRQAYDDLAQPVKLAVMLAVAPVVALSFARRRWERLVAGAVAIVALAEVGRRREGGGARFPRSAALWAPAWVAERSICVWIALARRVLLGGVRYRGATIRRAATPMRELRRRVGGQSPVVDAARARERAGA